MAASTSSASMLVVLDATVGGSYLYAVGQLDTVYANYRIAEDGQLQPLADTTGFFNNRSIETVSTRR